MNILNEVNNSNETEFALLECVNCKLHQSKYSLDTYGEESPYFIHFVTCERELISRRNFKNYDIFASSSYKNLEYTLCSQFNKYLTLQKT